MMKPGKSDERRGPAPIPATANWEPTSTPATSTPNARPATSSASSKPSATTSPSPRQPPDDHPAPAAPQIASRPPTPGVYLAVPGEPWSFPVSYKHTNRVLVRSFFNETGAT